MFEAGSGRCAGIGSVVANYARVGEREIDVVAAIDREIVDAALTNGVGARTAGGLNQRSFGTDLNHFLAGRDGKRNRELSHLSDRNAYACRFRLGKAGCVHVTE